MENLISFLPLQYMSESMKEKKKIPKVPYPSRFTNFSVTELILYNFKGVSGILNLKE